MTVNPCAVRSSSNNSRLDALSSATRIVPDSGGKNLIESTHSHRTSNARFTWDAEPKLVTGVTVPWPVVQFTKYIACNNRAATRYERLGGTVSTSVGAAPAITAETPPSTPALLSAMLRAATKVSDLIFSPGRPPIVEQDGRLLAERVQGRPSLTADHTQPIAADLIANNKPALYTLGEPLTCGISSVLPPSSPFMGPAFNHPRRSPL